jgi:hypothetical protein
MPPIPNKRHIREYTSYHLPGKNILTRKSSGGHQAKRRKEEKT